MVDGVAVHPVLFLLALLAVLVFVTTEDRTVSKGTLLSRDRFGDDLVMRRSDRRGCVRGLAVALGQDQTCQSNQREEPMPDKHVGEAKGRLKQAAGNLTDDQQRKDEGKADQTRATFKDKVDKVVDALSSRDKEVGRR